MNIADTSQQALLLVAHGTRDSLGLAQTLEVAAALAQRWPDVIVEPCFLELAEPNIAAGLSRCVARGARRITVQPLLLFSAGHAQRDIPRAVAEAAEGLAGLEIRQGTPLGCHPKLLELSALRFEEALAEHNQMPDEQTLLLMVGRGSRDAGANSEMARYSRLRWEQRPLGWLETCFAAMTRPSLKEALPLAAGLGYRRIVVQPHLLFEGELLAGVRRDVQLAEQHWPHCQWICTGPLGPHPWLIEALGERAGLSPSNGPPAAGGPPSSAVSGAASGAVANSRNAS